MSSHDPRGRPPLVAQEFGILPGQMPDAGIIVQDLAGSWQLLVSLPGICLWLRHRRLCGHSSISEALLAADNEFHMPHAKGRLDNLLLQRDWRCFGVAGFERFCKACFATKMHHCPQNACSAAQLAVKYAALASRIVKGDYHLG